MLVDGAAPVTVAQARPGHADPRATLGIHSHVIGESHRNAVEKIAVVSRMDELPAATQRCCQYSEHGEVG